MMRRIKIMCSCVITVCLLAISLWYLTDLMEAKRSDSKYLPFLEQSENFDVLFMGTSHVSFGIYPLDLWRDYGIISYNMGGHGDLMPTTYWVMENALEQTTPKLVVIDCLSLRREEKTIDIFSNVHYSLDGFPLNMTKLAAIQDLLDDPVMDRMQQEGIARELRERTSIEFWWDFSIYHTRWNELSYDDFIVPRTKGKGIDYAVAIATPDEVVRIPSEQKFEEETTQIKYLRKMIEDCQNRGIEVLLTYVPFPAPEFRQMDANRIYDIADKYDVNYINFLDMDIVNYNTDCYDADHLNPSGGRKVTEYIGQYIMEHYNISDQRDNPAYDSWYEDYREWMSFKIDILKEQSALDLYLMLLADKGFDIVLEINNPMIWENEYYVNILENLGVDMKLVTESTNFLVIEAAGKNIEYLDELDTAEINMDFTAESIEENEKPDICIIVMNSETREIVDQAIFML